MQNTFSPAGQAPKGLTFQEGAAALYTEPPPEETVLPPATRTLAQLVQAYNEALAEFETATAEREQLAEALLQAQTEQRALASSLKNLHEDWQDALLTEKEPAAKSALALARAELVDRNELVNALLARKGRMSYDDTASSYRIFAGKDAVMAWISTEELKLFKPEALAVLHAAWSAQTTQAWADWLPSVLAPPPDKGAVQLAVLDRHKVVLG